MYFQGYKYIWWNHTAWHKKTVLYNKNVIRLNYEDDYGAWKIINLILAKRENDFKTRVKETIVKGTLPADLEHIASLSELHLQSEHIQSVSDSTR